MATVVVFKNLTTIPNSLCINYEHMSLAMKWRLAISTICVDKSVDKTCKYAEIRLESRVYLNLAIF